MKTDSKNPTRWMALCLVSVATTFSAAALTPEEGTSLLYMKQEEKVARDVYQALGARWDHATLRNIATSEQRHMDAVDGLITRYGLADTTPAEAGRYTIPELQELYDALVARGSVSLVEALRVGVVVEETDIADLKAAISVVGEPVIARVFGNLLRASGQHLTAFQSAVAVVEGGGSGVVADPSTCARGGVCGNGGGKGQGGKGPGQGQGLGKGKGKGQGKGNGNGNGQGGRGAQSGTCGAGAECVKGGLGDCGVGACVADGTGAARVDQPGTGAQVRRGQR